MKFGFSHPLPVSGLTNHDPAFVAKEIEDAGLESYWVGDHLIAPVQCDSYSPVFPGGQVPGFLDPLVALARASAVTSRIKLGPSVLLMPERNPIHLAKEIATLDAYSNGRFILAVGSGWNREETEIMGGDAKRPWAQTLEGIEVLKKLWTQDIAQHQGAFYNFPEVRCYPKPAQRPHPPVLIGGNASKVLERVVNYGDGWLPHRYEPAEVGTHLARLRRLMADAGRDYNALDITFTYGEEIDLERIRQFEEAGVQRLIIRLPAGLSEPQLADTISTKADLLLR